jgi:hypothetical protein
MVVIDRVDRAMVYADVYAREREIRGDPLTLDGSEWVGGSNRQMWGSGGTARVGDRVGGAYLIEIVARHPNAVF